MKQAIRTQAVFALLCVLASACGDDNLPDYFRLGGLRVLAIQSGSDGGSAEVDGNAGVPVSVPFRVLVNDLDSGGRTLSYVTESCTDPGVSYGATPSCDGVPDRVAVAAGTGSVSSGAWGAGTSYTGVISFNVDVPPGGLLGRSAVNQFNGVAYLVTFRITGGSETVSTFKRVVITSRPTRNNNPAAPAILSNGAVLSAMPSQASELSAPSAAASAESYQLQSSDGTAVDRVEDPYVSWFITDGELERSRTAPTGGNELTPPESAPAGRTPVVIAVVRDARGGESWLIQPL